VRSQPPSGQSWSTFLKTDGKDIWACDFVPVVTLFFKTIHAFVIGQHESRRVVHFGVTEHPTDEWITQQRVAQASGVEVIHTPYEAPRSNAICERFVGSLRRERLDHRLVIGVLQLIRIQKEYVSDFNQARPRRGLAQRIPEPMLSPPGGPKVGKVIAFRV
jgi:hypothetical protein